MAKYLIPLFFFPSSKICSYMSEVLNGILYGKWGTCVTSERVSLLHFSEKLLPKKTYDHAFSTAQSVKWQKLSSTPVSNLNVSKLYDS